MPEAFSPSTPEAQHVRPRFVPVRSSLGNPHAPPPPSSPPRGVRTASLSVAQKPKLLDHVRAAIRLRHYSLRTEETYVHWIKRFIIFHGKRHPRELGAPAVEAFLTHLAVEGKVAANTQNLALSALLFLYKDVLAIDLPWLTDVTRAKRPRRLPTVLSRAETTA